MKNADTKNNYQLKTENDKLIFKTSSFKAEKTSVLHSGVYTREFSSLLLSSALCILVYMLSDLTSSKSAALRYIILIFIFVLSFLGAHKFIFKDRSLEAVFDKADKTVNITRSGLFKKKKEKILLSHIKSVKVGSRAFVPENIDGIDFVQKISAQHGSPVPGLSKAEEFITLSLILKDDSEKIIYAVKINGGKIDGEPVIPVNEIRRFLGNDA